MLFLSKMSGHPTPSATFILPSERPGGSGIMKKVCWRLDHPEFKDVLDRSGLYSGIHKELPHTTWGELPAVQVLGPKSSSKAVLPRPASTPHGVPCASPSSRAGFTSLSISPYQPAPAGSQRHHLSTHNQQSQYPALCKHCLITHKVDTSVLPTEEQAQVSDKGWAGALRCTRPWHSPLF